MEAFSSIGLSEILLTAAVVGLALFAVTVIAILVVARRRKETKAPETEAGRPAIGKWVLLVGLVFLLVLPLCVVAGGVVVGGAMVMPVRRSQTMVEGPTPEVVVVKVNATAVPAAVAMPVEPSPVPPAAAPSQLNDRSLSVTPGEMSLFALPGLAGLVVLLGAAIMVVLGRPRSPVTPQVEDNEENGDRPAWLTKVKLGFLAFAFWFALSVFLILDVNFAVSVYLELVVIYGGFWILVGALLLVGRPTRDKLLILGLFALLLLSIQFINWNSRKPFLRSFRRIEVGMSAPQVEETMIGYMVDYGGGSPGSQPQTQFDDDGRILNGSMTFRHTQEGWGDSDWGVVTFEDGHVVETRFLPD